MKLAVITPTLGSSPWLREGVASVSSHAPGCTHVLACPRDQVEELARAYPQCAVVPDKGAHRGMYAAINAGLASVEGWDAFTYLNDDDCLLGGFQPALGQITDPARLLMVYGGVRLIDTKGGRLGAIPVSPLPRLNRALYAQRLEPVYQHGTIVTRAAWERCGGFDESFRLCGDSEYLARLCVAEVQAIYVPATVAAFRLRAGQLTKRRAEMQAERARVDEKLGLLHGSGRIERWWARLVFRLGNAPVYAERVARHGFKRFDDVLAGVE